jgi:uncharacterized membrane protein YkgB
MVNNADAIKTRMTSGAGGKPEAAFQMCMITLSFLIRMPKLWLERLCFGGACCYLFLNEDPNLNGVVLDNAIGIILK